MLDACPQVHSFVLLLVLVFHLGVCFEGSVSVYVCALAPLLHSSVSVLSLIFVLALAMSEKSFFLWPFPTSMSLERNMQHADSVRDLVSFLSF